MRNSGDKRYFAILIAISRPREFAHAKNSTCSGVPFGL